MQRHGDVEVERIVVDHTDGEEHGHHNHIVPGKKGHRIVETSSFFSAAESCKCVRFVDIYYIDYFFYLMCMAGFLLPKFASKMNPSNAMNKNCAKVTMLPHPGKSL